MLLDWSFVEEKQTEETHSEFYSLPTDAGCDINHVAHFRGRHTAPILCARNCKNAVKTFVNLVRLNVDLELTGCTQFVGHWNLPLERVTAFQLALLDGHVLAAKVLALGGARLTPPTVSDEWKREFLDRKDREWICALLSNPRSLKQSCRNRIRQCLCVKPDAAIDKLPLPVAIKCYLTIPELKDFEQYFTEPSFT